MKFAVRLQSLEGGWYDPHWVIVTHRRFDTFEAAWDEAQRMLIANRHNRQVGRIWVNEP